MNGDATTETTTPTLPVEPPSINIWETASSNEKAVYYVVRHPWQWVMEDLTQGLDNMEPVDNPNHLPLAKQQQQQQQQQNPTGTPTARRYHRRLLTRTSMSQGRASLRLEVIDKATNQVVLAAHGTSGCFEGLADKDELVRTIHRCRCEHLHLSPPSILIQWDVSKEECLNVVGKTLPRIVSPSSSNSTSGSSPFAVLKEPMGSQGKGIFFVRNASEIHEVIDRNHRRASDEPDLLERLIADKGRIPSWVLQAEVYPSLLIRGRRKFHIRSYVVVVERPDDELLDMYIYTRHEVRIAGLPIENDYYSTVNDEKSTGTADIAAVGVESDSDSLGRNPLAHISNGALSDNTERVLLDQLPELKDLDIPRKLEIFLAQIFAKHLLSDISRRISPQLTTTVAGLGTDNGTGASTPVPPPPIRHFAIAGTDLMVTEDLRLYLLEVNVNPAAPPKNVCADSFREHLRTFFRDLVNLVTIGTASVSFDGDGGDDNAASFMENFHDAFEILEREQQEAT